MGDVFIPLESRQGFGVEGRTQSRRNQLWEPVQDADLVILNLEAPLTSRTRVRQEKVYNLRSGPEVVECFGPNVVACLANNHIMDFGVEGLRDTLQVLRHNRIPHCGAGRNLEEANDAVTLERSGVRFGIMAAADPRYQAATESVPGTNPASGHQLFDSIAQVKSHTHFAIVTIHMGMEFSPAPTPKMLTLAEGCLSAGADVIQFHHAHCVSGVTEYEKGVVLWGTGNFLFPYTASGRLKSWYEGAVWILDIDKETREVVSLRPRPIVLNSDGFPHLVTGERATQILLRINRWSHRIARREFLGAWRFLTILDPRYLRAALNNYYLVLKKQGLRELLHLVCSTLKTQFFPNPR